MKGFFCCPVCHNHIPDNDIPENWWPILRDFFAGCALIMFGPPSFADPSRDLTAEDARAIRAYDQADAMMKERKK